MYSNIFFGRSGNDIGFIKDNLCSNSWDVIYMLSFGPYLIIIPLLWLGLLIFNINRRNRGDGFGECIGYVCAFSYFIIFG